MRFKKRPNTLERRFFLQKWLRFRKIASIFRARNPLESDQKWRERKKGDLTWRLYAGPTPSIFCFGFRRKKFPKKQKVGQWDAESVFQPCKQTTTCASPQSFDKIRHALKLGVCIVGHQGSRDPSRLPPHKLQGGGRCVRAWRCQAQGPQQPRDERSRALGVVSSLAAQSFLRCVGTLEQHSPRNSISDIACPCVGCMLKCAATMITKSRLCDASPSPTWDGAYVHVARVPCHCMPLISPLALLAPLALAWHGMAWHDSLEAGGF